jgi:type II secretory pathway pseudopilin PulG
MKRFNQLSAFRLPLSVTESKAQLAVVEKRSAGFTIIEALVTITIIALISLILMGILSNGFAGSTKTQLVGNIKQDGQTALNIISGDLKFSQGIVCPNGTPGTGSVLVLQDKDGNLKRFYYSTYVAGTTNGKIMQDFPAISSTLTGDDYCDTSVGKAPPNSPNTVTDDTNVSVKALNFNVRKENGISPIVEISINIGPSETTRNIFAEKTPDIIFKTKVQLR